jgi:hypothetical protein
MHNIIWEGICHRFEFELELEFEFEKKNKKRNRKSKIEKNKEEMAHWAPSHEFGPLKKLPRAANPSLRRQRVDPPRQAHSRTDRTLARAAGADTGGSTGHSLARAPFHCRTRSTCHTAAASTSRTPRGPRLPHAWLVAIDGGRGWLPPTPCRVHRS